MNEPRVLQGTSTHRSVMSLHAMLTSS